MANKVSAMDTLRVFMSAKPPINIVAALQALGVRARQDADLPDGISGHLRRIDGRYEAASSRNEHAYRQRFTLAHELGHYVLHRDLVGNGVDDNTQYRSTERGDIYNSAIKVEHERQANSFAANFLMPRPSIEKEFEDTEVKRLMDLVHRYQVSPSAMKWRLKNLEIPPEKWTE